MVVLYFVLFLLALVCFVASAFQVNSPKIYLLGFGLALWVAVPLIQQMQRL